MLLAPLCLCAKFNEIAVIHAAISRSIVAASARSSD